MFKEEILRYENYELHEKTSIFLLLLPNYNIIICIPRVGVIDCNCFKTCLQVF